MKTFRGLTASTGLVAGAAYLHRKADLGYDPEKFEGPETESRRLSRAVEQAHGELSALKDTMSDGLGQEYGHIFRAQMTMLEDEDFKSEIGVRIAEQRLCAEAALEKTLAVYRGLFEELGDDTYNRQRLADLEDVGKRILKKLVGGADALPTALPADCVVVAEELLPSDTAQMNTRDVRGFVTEKGGATSHVAILAKSLGLPAAVSTPGLMQGIASGERLWLDLRDPEKALVYAEPDAETERNLSRQAGEYQKEQADLLADKDAAPVTRDGKKITLSANIGSLADLDLAQRYGAKSVGLLRTEFLFLGRDTAPDEEEQYRFYAQVVRQLQGGMVVIRTLDIGGDKEVQSLALPKEENPFLGLRGLRLCLKHEDLFLVQLRALLRAALLGDLRIMFPMVSALEELRQAKTLLRRAAADLDREGVPYRRDVEPGVMVETPAAVLLADELTREGGFISLGTNDLTQYVLAVDRGNENVGAFYRAFSPAVFRAIDISVRAAAQNGKWAGVCGELGGNPLAVPVLIGLGVEELSMSGRLLPSTIRLIRSLTYAQCRDIADKVLSLATEDEIRTYLKQVLYTETGVEA